MRPKICQLQDAIETVVRGKREAVRLALVCLLAEGHLLIEDVPGVGKTTLAHSLARVFDCTFRRIQFTSDLLPSDILGVSLFNQAGQTFSFRRGPIFAHIVLADEINRTTPKTQSALAGSHERGQGERRQSNPSAPASFYGSRHTKSHRASRHLSASRIPAGPISSAHQNGIPGQ